MFVDRPALSIGYIKRLHVSGNRLSSCCFGADCHNLRLNGRLIFVQFSAECLERYRTLVQRSGQRLVKRNWTEMAKIQRKQKNPWYIYSHVVA